MHTALGAFVAGVLVGQSPILTEHIEGELRGFIIAFFSPVFFAVAGLGMDLRTLLDPTLLLVTFAVILVASLGKFLGALLGGRLGGLTGGESLALATGLNARGSTEVIIASIGLALGALSSQLYTMIVAMAVVTTMAMPPTLRWMLARVPLRDDEAKRLDKEDAEAQDSVPKMERALVYLDQSANGLLAASLAGMFAAHRQVMATVMERSATPAGEGASVSGFSRVAEAAALIHRGATAAQKDTATPEALISPEALIQVKPASEMDAVDKEASKGYDLIFVGLERPISSPAQRFEDQVQRLVDAFDGPVAILFNAPSPAAKLDSPLNILVPAGGTPEARLATELALALAGASHGTLTALHVFDLEDDTNLLRGRARRLGMSILVDARRLGKRSGIVVKGVTMTSSRPEAAIRRAVRAGGYDLVVIGTSLRVGDKKFIGSRSAALLRDLRSPVLLVAQ